MSVFHGTLNIHFEYCVLCAQSPFIKFHCTALSGWHTVEYSTEQTNKHVNTHRDRVQTKRSLLRTRLLLFLELCRKTEYIYSFKD